MTESLELVDMVCRLVDAVLDSLSIIVASGT